jgi:flagellar biogenesis protein FliO
LTFGHIVCSYLWQGKGAFRKVAKSKIKLVMVLAALILAGGILPAVSRVTATSGPPKEDASAYGLQRQGGQKTEDGMQRTDFSSSAIRPQPSAVSGREFYYKMLVSVSLVIVLGAAAVYVSRKLLPRLANLPTRQIRVLETAYLAPRKGIHLIQAGTRRLLVASTNETITMLADVTESNLGETAASSVESFGHTMPDFAAQLKMRS